MKLYFLLLAAVAVERLFEVWLSRRHAAWAFDRGGVELGQRGQVWMGILHASFLLACAAEVWWLARPFLPALGIPMIALVAAAQTLRVWTMVALGPRWNTRVIVIPGTPVVSSGPYRFVRHPNYLGVIIEGFAIPLLHCAWYTATAFTVLNAWWLVGKIRCEEGALSTYCDDQSCLATRPRFFPVRSHGETG